MAHRRSIPDGSNDGEEGTTAPDRPPVERALPATEAPLRRLAERSQDIVYRYRLEPDPVLEYVSPAATRLTGYTPEEFYADPDLWTRLAHPDDRARVALAGQRGNPDEPVVARWVRRDGSTLWTEDRRVWIVDADGAVVAIEGIARDVTERVEAEQRLRASEMRFRNLLSDIDLCSLMLDAEGRVEFINDHFLNLLRRTREEMLGRNWVDVAVPARDRQRVRKVFRAAVAAGRGAGQGEASVVTASGEERRLAWTSVIQQDANGQVLGFAAIAHDVTDVQRLEAERTLLASAVEQSAESVIITDSDARITYVNRAFEHLTRYTRAEVIGQNPRILNSGQQAASFYKAMWAALTSGLPWVAEFTNRRKDGSLYRITSVTSPIRGSDGSISNYVANDRDVTHERDLETRTDLLTRERALIGETLRVLPSGGTLESTADLFCRQVASLTDVVVAGLIVFDADGLAIPIAYLAPDSRDVGLRRHSPERSRYLRDHAAAGPWVETWKEDPSHPYAESLRKAGVRAFAYAPVHSESSVVGVLAVGSAEESAVAQLSGQLGAIVDFADLAGALLGQRVIGRRDKGRLRGEIEGIISSAAFTPVFQPIVDLLHRRIVGYEALTRFDDRVPPDVRFAEASSVGIGVQLEAATLEAAVSRASRLSPSRWLHLNVSPELVLARTELARLLSATRARVVLEVTEHAVIDDYRAFRAAISAIGRPVQLAVDDAGAGFASLRHILELRPAFVKLDISLVRDIDADPAKQALVAGMRHFARNTHRRLIAEGVETESEATTLRDLEIRLGQGYLLGRPAPLEAQP